MFRAAQESGQLPHEFLLKVMQTGWMDTFDKEGNLLKRIPVSATARIECASRAAPFFAPRMAMMKIDTTNQMPPVAALMMDLLRSGHVTSQELSVLEKLIGRVSGERHATKLLEVTPSDAKVVETSDYESTLNGGD